MGLKDLLVSRDEDGKLIPREGVTPTLGLEIKVLPLTFGQSKQYKSFGIAMKDWPSEEKAKLLTENFLMIDGEEVGEFTADDVDDIEAWALTDLLEGFAGLSALWRLYEKKGDREQGNPPQEGTESSEEEKAAKS